MKDELSFLFNTERLFLGKDLPELDHYLDNIKLSSPDLIVYSNNSLEVMISDVGMVSISAGIEEISELKEFLPRIFDEYNKLTRINTMFTPEKNFKIIAPKQVSNKITEQLTDLNYEVRITDTADSDTLFVTH